MDRSLEKIKRIETGSVIMSRNAVQTDNAPQAIGPYSQALRSGELLFLSGQIPLDPASGEIINGDIQTQAERVLDNLAAVLEAAGADFSSVVKTTVYLKDMNDFAAVNEVYAKRFSAPFPARAAVEVAALPKGVGVEIDAIAHLPGA